MIGNARQRFATAMLIAAAAAGCYDANRVFGRTDMKHDPFDFHHEVVSLADVQANPDAFMNQPIEFDLMYFGYDDERIWAPMYTPFTADRFMPFSGWDPRAPIWSEEVYTNPMRTLFLERTEHDLDVEGWPSRDRFAILRIYGVVKSVFAGKPWIQVTEIDTIDEPQFSVESLGALSRAMDLQATGSPAARAALERVLTMPLSAEARRQVHLTLGAICLAGNDGNGAVMHLETAETMTANERERNAIRASLERARQLRDRQNVAEELKEPPPEPKSETPK